jgi:undecaprenyl diphosphate synthase
MHVAIIMNGNSRWATQRGLSAATAEDEGVAALRNTAASAANAGVRTLTLYALCAVDCARPRQEINADLNVLGDYLRHTRNCAAQAIRVSLIGHHERLSGIWPAGGQHNTHAHASDTRMHLRIVVDYSAHDSVVKAAWNNPEPDAARSFDQKLREIDDTALSAGAVDLLVRTGGGRCHSEFMLWEVAYARLHYVDCLWPDFTEHCLQRALAAYSGHTERVVSIA